MGSSQPRDWTQDSHIAGRFFAIWATRKPVSTLQRPISPFSFPLSLLFGILAHFPQGFPFIHIILSSIFDLIFTESIPSANKPIRAAPIVKTQAKHSLIPLFFSLPARLCERGTCFWSFCFFIFSLISLILNFHLQNIAKTLKQNSFTIWSLLKKSYLINKSFPSLSRPIFVRGLLENSAKVFLAFGQMAILPSSGIKMSHLLNSSAA